jgi:hypothetical protein
MAGSSPRATATYGNRATLGVPTKAPRGNAVLPRHGPRRTTTLSAHKQVRQVSYPGGHVRQCDMTP